MNSALNKILEQIRLNAQLELEKLRVDYDKKILQIKHNAQRIINFDKSVLNKKIETSKKNLEIKINAENDIFKSKTILAKKQVLFSRVLKKAIEILCCDSNFETRYFNYMENLIEKNLPKDFCVLFYGELDYLRFCDNLKFNSSTFLKIEKSINFEYGAEILCSTFKVDLKIESLLVERCEGVKAEILKILV